MLRFLFILISISLLSTNLNAKEASIPLKFFNQMPMVEQPSISPDGENIAVILNQEDLTQVAIFPFDGKTKMQLLLQLGGEKYRIESIAWANNERILVTVSQPLRIDDWGNLRVRSSHIYSAKIDGSDVFELRKKSRKDKVSTFYLKSPRLKSLLEDEPNHVLVTMNDERDNHYSSVFKVNVNTGEFEKHIANTNRIFHWGVNKSGEVLLGLGSDKNQKVNKKYIYVRKNIDADWKMVKTYEAYKTETFEVVVYEPEKNSIIVISDYKLNKAALWRFDIASGEYELLGEAPGTLDVTGAITRLEGKKRSVVGFEYNDNFIKRVYFDENNTKFAQQITSIFSKSNLQASLYDWDRNKQRYIISAVSDTAPGRFYIYDKKINKIKPWYTQFPDLDSAQLAKVQPFDFEARDGMKLHGYLTLPNNVKNPPVVLFPHGGPFARDSQYFNPYVQMFASRGYAVLQVNFRGSTGYGNKYYTAGYHQWGKKMQTDLMDAMAWLKDTKQADTDNACIVGASYGGYAALAAGYQTPDKFKCIVSIAGTANMKTTLNDWRRRGYKNYIKNAVTDDENELKDLSPVNHASEFKAPVLLIHGKVDISVNYSQSKDMHDALEDAGKKVDIKLFKFGTHHLDDAVNRKNAMELISTFLEKHLD